MPATKRASLKIVPQALGCNFQSSPFGCRHSRVFSTAVTPDSTWKSLHMMSAGMSTISEPKQGRSTSIISLLQSSVFLFGDKRKKNDENRSLAFAWLAMSSLHEKESLLAVFQCFPLRLLNDRKSRHRRIKKQRRYERNFSLDATSQKSMWL